VRTQIRSETNQLCVNCRCTPRFHELLFVSFHIRRIGVNDGGQLEARHGMEAGLGYTGCSDCTNKERIPVRIRVVQAHTVYDDVERNGYADSLFRRILCGTKSWAIPAPNRIAIFPLPNGSHASPTRGSTLFHWNLCQMCREIRIAGIREARGALGITVLRTPA